MDIGFVFGQSVGGGRFCRDVKRRIRPRVVVKMTNGRAERPDAELEEAEKLYWKKEARKEEKKEKRQARLERERILEEKKSAPNRKPSRKADSGARNKKVKGVSPVADSVVSTVMTRNFKPEDIVGVRFGGSYTTDVPSNGLPEIAFIGRSNVGKSSAINCITGSKKKIAKTSKQPGRTQQINLFHLNDSKERDVLTLVDLPGYGFAKINKEDQRQIEGFLESYLLNRNELKLIVLLIDCRRDPQQADLEVLEALRATQCPVLVVCTKIDLLNPQELARNVQAFVKASALTEDDEVLLFSSVSGQGRGYIWQVIKDAILGKL